MKSFGFVYNILTTYVLAWHKEISNTVIFTWLRCITLLGLNLNCIAVRLEGSFTGDRRR